MYDNGQGLNDRSVNRHNEVAMGGIVDVGGGRRVHRRSRETLYGIAHVGVAGRVDVGPMTLGVVDVRLCGFTYRAIFPRFMAKYSTGARGGEPTTNYRWWIVLRLDRHAAIPDGRAAFIIVVMDFFLFDACGLHWPCSLLLSVAHFFVVRLIAERIVGIDESRHFTNAEREQRMSVSIRATLQKTIADFVSTALTQHQRPRAAAKPGGNPGLVATKISRMARRSLGER